MADYLADDEKEANPQKGNPNRMRTPNLGSGAIPKYGMGGVNDAAGDILGALIRRRNRKQQMALELQKEKAAEEKEKRMEAFKAALEDKKAKLAEERAAAREAAAEKRQQEREDAINKRAAAKATTGKAAPLKDWEKRSLQEGDFPDDIKKKPGKDGKPAWWQTMSATKKAKIIRDNATLHGWKPAKNQPGGFITNDAPKKKTSPAAMLSGLAGVGKNIANIPAISNMFQPDKAMDTTESPDTQTDPEANVPKVVYEPSGPAQIETAEPQPS